MSNASPATFEDFVKSTQVSVRCKVCKFFKAYPTEAEGIRDSIKRRGMSIVPETPNSSSEAYDRRVGQHVTPKQIATYVSTKYPESKVSISNVYDHWRNDHEERA